MFWSAQLVVLFFYSLTGMWKIYFSFKALFEGRIGGFSFGGFSYIVANRILQGNEDTVLGDFFVHHEIIGWALFIGTMYLEGASILIVFRPRLHRVWGVGLILFHFVMRLTMGFAFPENVALVGLLFVCSPFTPEKVSVKEAISDLPGLHFVVRRFARARRLRRVRRAVARRRHHAFRGVTPSTANETTAFAPFPHCQRATPRLGRRTSRPLVVSEDTVDALR